MEPKPCPFCGAESPMVQEILEVLRDADRYVRSRMVKSGIVNQSAARMHERLVEVINKLDIANEPKA